MKIKSKICKKCKRSLEGCSGRELNRLGFKVIRCPARFIYKIVSKSYPQLGGLDKTSKRFYTYYEEKNKIEEEK